MRVLLQSERREDTVEQRDGSPQFPPRRGEHHDIPAITIEAVDLPEDVLSLLDSLLALGGTYGDPSAGDPIQHDELRIEHDQGIAEIVVYNRAILLFTTDSEAVRRVHQVCCPLDDQGALER